MAENPLYTLEGITTVKDNLLINSKGNFIDLYSKIGPSSLKGSQTDAATRFGLEHNSLGEHITNIINEKTIGTGVTIDGVLIKDGLIDGRDVSTDGTILDNAKGSCVSLDARLDITLNEDGTSKKISDTAYNETTWDGVTDTAPSKNAIRDKIVLLETCETWQVPTLLNGWTNYGSPFAPVEYWKDNYGIIHLRGLVRSGTVGTSIFLLPVGYRPPYQQIFIVMTNNTFGRCDIQTSGNVLTTDGNNAYFCLDSISFKCN